jgi:hypothetical protein
VRLIGPDPDLAGWLADTFVRHFGEVAGLDRDAEPLSSTAFLAVAEVWTLDG